MQSWRKRFLIYKILGALPYGQGMMNTIRRRVSNLSDYDFKTRAYLFEDFRSLYAENILPVNGSSFIEIGAGWHPVLSLILYGLGAKRVVLTDVYRHMRCQYVQQTINYVRSEGVAALSKLEDDLDLKSFQERLDALVGAESTVFERLEEVGIEYQAPLDFCKNPFHDDEFDCIVSNSCLGYIPAPILQGIFQESSRVLRPGGCMFHSIHVLDDYSGTDKTISRVNFLQYSAEEWERIGNTSLHYQNRLRPRDYVRMAQNVGFDIEIEDRIHMEIPGHSTASLAPEFQTLPEEEIFCRRLFLVARRQLSEQPAPV